MDKPSAQILQNVVLASLIKLPQLLLLLLANKQHEGWCLLDITRATGARATAVSMAKQKLIDLEFVEEHFPERDKRMTKLYLTPKGREEASKLWITLRQLVAAEDSLRESTSVALDQKL